MPSQSDHPTTALTTRQEIAISSGRGGRTDDGSSVEQGEQDLAVPLCTWPGSTLPPIGSLFLLPRMPETFYKKHGYRPCAIEHPYSRVQMQTKTSGMVTNWCAKLEASVFSEEELFSRPPAKRRQAYVARLAAHVDALVAAMNDLNVPLGPKKDMDVWKWATGKAMKTMIGALEYENYFMAVRLQELQRANNDLALAVHRARTVNNHSNAVTMPGDENQGEYDDNERSSSTP